MLEGGTGGDALDGGTVSDTASYENAGYGVWVDLEAAWDNSGEAIGDSYVSIENIRGSSFRRRASRQ